MRVLTVQQKNIMRSAVVFFMVLSLSLSGIASKGGGDDKEKKGYVLKFNGFEVKKQYSTPFSMMKGATYKGTYYYKLDDVQNKEEKSEHSIITYKRGNTIIILPVKTKGMIQKFQVPRKENFKY